MSLELEYSVVELLVDLTSDSRLNKDISSEDSTVLRLSFFDVEYDIHCDLSSKLHDNDSSERSEDLSKLHDNEPSERSEDLSLIVLLQ